MLKAQLKGAAFRRARKLDPIIVFGRRANREVLRSWGGGAHQKMVLMKGLLL